MVNSPFSNNNYRNGVVQSEKNHFNTRKMKSFYYICGLL